MVQQYPVCALISFYILLSYSR
ncbi:hypothetical protein AAFF_G00272990 [Aldrovandia affinis]|uniref:Uncharacterized protein n=1 Tax=Aldrovandia affinis TaxID=143900 RepID=A0AAD7WSB4_9TELE|nr:hypothetical protein AAFF_G00272990 [Aldrovandia affinis]